VIYYEYGALVLVYNNGERATRAFNILQDAVFDSKPLLVLLLPNILVSPYTPFTQSSKRRADIEQTSSTGLMEPRPWLKCRPGLAHS